jgi:hypothetical protein
MAVEKAYYIYIGINYLSVQNKSHKLKFSNDAEEVCQILNLPEDNYGLYTNGISKKELIDILKNLNSEKFSGFDILVYIAGHGTSDELQKPSLKTSDGELRFYDIFELLDKNTHANNIAVILDCCYSGISESPKRNMYWIAATSENTTTNSQFHENLVNYLSNNNNNLTIYGLIEYLQLHGHIEQPSTTTRSNKPFNIVKHRNPISTEVNEYFLRKRGRLRTAYPINISFNQMFDKRLYIESTIQDGKKEISLNAYFNYYSTTKSYLILGDPGVGKSFLSFLLQKKFLTLNYNVIALSFQEISWLLSTNNPQLNNEEEVQIKKIINDAITNKTDKMIFLIDGLDEFGKWDEYDGFLDKLTRNAGVIAFSRGIEYNNNVSKYLPEEMFDEILTVKKWHFEQEFISFLTLLSNNQYISNDKCDRILNDAKDFQEHLLTPLYSRMYIYVHENNSKNGLPINNKTGLYFSYIQNLANNDGKIIDFWKTITFDAFVNLRNNYSIITESKYSNAIKKYQPEQRRIISNILQLKTGIHGNYYNFIHYSFYEFFVALYISSQFRESFMSTHTLSDVSDLFRFDLSFPIRHYLVDLFNLDPIIQQEGFISFLRSLYESIKGNNKTDLIKKNLIIYLISKQDKEMVLLCLKIILNNETDIFIKNSLYWACIRKNDKQIFDLYISLLSSNQDYGFYNRGYHLYYYGDIVSEDFPFIDKYENTLWNKTRKFMMDHRIKVHTDDSPFIRLLDIWTYIDLAIFHRTSLKNDEITSLKNNYNNLLSSLNNDTMRLFDKLFIQLEGITK